MTFERKFQLGIVFREEVPSGQSPGLRKTVNNLLRAAAAEFLGMLLFLFMGERVVSPCVAFLAVNDALVVWVCEQV